MYPAPQEVAQPSQQPPRPDGASDFDCIVQFAGGHSSLLRHTDIDHVRRELLLAREEGLEFVYLQPGDRPANSVVVDPRQVVALFVKHH